MYINFFMNYAPYVADNLDQISKMLIAAFNKDRTIMYTFTTLLCDVNFGCFKRLF